MRLDWQFLQEKAVYYNKHKKIRQRRQFLYHANRSGLRIRVRHLDFALQRLPLRGYLSWLRWCLIDFLRGKNGKFSGIYAYIGLPGEGKTLSMVAHIERVKEKDPDVRIATNFNYVSEDMRIEHWLDIIRFAADARREHKCCIVAMDEIHVTFDSADWQHFPAEMLSLISFNRKYNLQFICSSQIYERIPKKIRDICNYIVICKNVLDTDRMFKNYYYKKSDYDTMFDGKLKKADFVREYVASDWLYSRYDTKQLVENLTSSAKEEKDRRQEAFEILFSSHRDDNV